MQPIEIERTSTGGAGSDAGRVAALGVRPKSIGRLVLKSLREHPRWLIMYTAGRFRFISNLAVSLRPRPTLEHVDDATTIFRGVDIDRVVTNLRRDGLYAGINLDPATVAEITTFATRERCYWPERPEVRFAHDDRTAVESEFGRPLLLGRYFDIEDRCPAVRAIACDPVLRQIATHYLNAVPQQVETRLWWSFVSQASVEDRLEADQGFHYDLHDYRSLAFFFHLTDVDASSGLHVCVVRSHVRKPLRKLLSTSRQLSDAEVLRIYGSGAIAPMCGNAGFGFAEDPFCYHKGAPPTRRDRLMLRVRFTIHDDGTRVDRSERH
jgi:hypothetical protein